MLNFSWIGFGNGADKSKLAIFLPYAFKFEATSNGAKYGPFKSLQGKEKVSKAKDNIADEW